MDGTGNERHLDPAVRDLAIEYRPVRSLKPWSRNPRTHSSKQIRQIADSICVFGWTNPVLVDRDGSVIAGHGRLEAAKLLGIEVVPTIRLDHMTEAQRRAYVIADNRLAENAGWDRELLGLELQYLTELEIDFDLAVTGFELPEIDILIDELSLESENVSEPDPADEIPEPGDGPPVTQPGDIWCIGRHRLICGDAKDAGTYQRLLRGERAQMVFTDPPYNVPVQGHVSGLGKVKHREFAMARGEMSKAEFTEFLATVFRNLADYSVDGAIQFVCMDWRHMGEIVAAGGQAYTDLKNVCVWVKTNGGMGSLYRSKHELVFVFKAGSGPHINNVELGRYGRYRTNVWTYPGINSFGKDRDAELALHPTVKPVALVADAIRDCSHRKGNVLDAFAGSGTTLVAAEKTGRCGYGIELDPRYCDVIVRRIRDVCRLDAILEGSGRSFGEVSQERAPANAGGDTVDGAPNQEVAGAK